MIRALRVRPACGPLPDLDHVYTIGHPGGFQKIGCSIDPKKRLRELQAGSPVALTLTHIAACQSVAAVQIEGRVHQMLVEHRREREWFEVDLAVAVAAINRAAEDLGQAVEPIDMAELCRRLADGRGRTRAKYRAQIARPRAVPTPRRAWPPEPPPDDTATPGRDAA